MYFAQNNSNYKKFPIHRIRVNDNSTASGNIKKREYIALKIKTPCV